MDNGVRLFAPWTDRDVSFESGCSTDYFLPMKIALLLSGGVDSAVSLNLLKREGHDLTAFYIKVWLEDELAYLGNCPWEEDLMYARAICHQAGVPLEIVSLQSEYWERVVSYVLAELKAGRTPSPDIFCNQRIKFGAFYDKIDLSFAAVASGHYAVLEKNNGSVILKKGVDPVKDQTYFLFHLSAAQLSRALFPVGAYPKSDVRRLAREFALPNQDRKDSQGICFLGKIKYREFVKFHLGEKPGNFIEKATGKKIGAHRGYWYYTIGQRQGMGLPGGPWFVVGKEIDENIVYIAHQEQLKEARRNEFRAEAIHWINGAPNKDHLQVKIRHSPRVFNARIAIENGRALVTLADRDAGVAPGQFSVFYDGEICLGGGVIV